MTFASARAETITKAAAVQGRSLWEDARRRLMRNKAAVTGMIVLGLLVVAAVVGPWLSPFTYDEVNKSDVWLPPLQGGQLGTACQKQNVLTACANQGAQVATNGARTVNQNLHNLKLWLYVEMNLSMAVADGNLIHKQTT